MRTQHRSYGSNLRRERISQSQTTVNMVASQNPQTITSAFELCRHQMQCLCAQAACTPKELREILALAGPNVNFNTVEGIVSLAIKKSGNVATDRIRKRLQGIFQKAAVELNPE